MNIKKSVIRSAISLVLLSSIFGINIASADTDKKVVMPVVENAKSEKVVADVVVPKNISTDQVAQPSSDTVVATYTTKSGRSMSVTWKEVEDFYNKMFGEENAKRAGAPSWDKLGEKEREIVKDSLVTTRTTLQYARDNGFDKSKKYENAVEVCKEQTLVRTVVEDMLKAEMEDGGKLKDKLYEELLTQTKGEKQYDFTYAPVGSKDDAEAALKAIKAGKKSMKDIVKQLAKSGAKESDFTIKNANPYYGTIIPKETALQLAKIKPGVVDIVETSGAYLLVQVNKATTIKLPERKAMESTLANMAASKSMEKVMDKIRSETKLSTVTPVVHK